jgi:hypothetical protein
MIALRQPDKNMNQSISARYRFSPYFLCFPESYIFSGPAHFGINESGYLLDRHMRSVIPITPQGAPAPRSV